MGGSAFAISPYEEEYSAEAPPTDHTFEGECKKQQKNILLSFLINPILFLVFVKL